MVERKWSRVKTGSLGSLVIWFLIFNGATTNLVVVAVGVRMGEGSFIFQTAALC